MSKFKEILDFTLNQEGGYKLHKNPTEDFYTYAGITERDYPDWEGWNLIKQGITDENSLSKYVEDFYYNNYWKKIKGDKLPLPIAIVLFDTSVNLGIVRAIRLLQQTLNKYFNSNLTVDGVIGNKTISAVNKIKNQEELVKRYLSFRLLFYSNLPERYNVYKKGWFYRVLSLLLFIKGEC